MSQLIFDHMWDLCSWLIAILLVCLGIFVIVHAILYVLVIISMMVYTYQWKKHLRRVDQDIGAQTSTDSHEQPLHVSNKQ